MTDYVALADLKSFLRIPAADTDDDAELALAITAASNAVDVATNRQFPVTAASATARYFTAAWDASLGRYVVKVDDFMTTTGLAVAYDPGTGSYTESVTDFTVYPLNATAYAKPYTRLVMDKTQLLPTGDGAIEVTAKWGWTATPDAIKQATLIQAARFFKRRDAPFGIAGSPEMGNEMRLLSRLDPDVELLVSLYRRWWAAV